MSWLEPVPDPCLGCGFCCKQAPCEIAASKHDLSNWGPGKMGCPSLVWKYGRHWCAEVMKSTGEAREQRERTLAIGAGCCSSLNSDHLLAMHREGLTPSSDFGRMALVSLLRSRSRSSSPSSAGSSASAEATSSGSPSTSPRTTRG